MTHSIDPLPAADAAKEASPPTVDLMAALQASLEEARKAREARAAKKTASHNPDEFDPTHCRCQFMNNPPCSYCETGVPYDDE